MIFFASLAFLIVTLALGYLILLFWRSELRQPLLPLSFALGGSAITWQLFIIKFFARLSLDYWFFGLLFLELAIFCFWHYRRQALVWPALRLHPMDKSLNAFLLILIALAVSASLLRVASHPLITFDALVVWAHRVQILFYHQSDLLNSEAASFYFNLAKTNYPWHLSLLAWFHAKFIGSVDNTWINFLPWCYYGLLLSTLYSLAKEKLSQAWSLTLSLAVAIMPLIFYHSYNLYADLPLAFYLALIFLIWRRWLISLATSDFLLLAILIGAALTVKSEAIFFAGGLVLLSAIKVFRAKLSIKQLWPLALTLIIHLPWLVWMNLNNLGLSNVGGGLAWHGAVTGSILSGLFIASSWHLWWYLLVLILVLNWTKLIKQELFVYSWAWFLTSLGAFLGIYYFTEAYQYVLDNSALSRNFILLIPLSFAILVDGLATWFESSK